MEGDNSYKDRRRFPRLPSQVYYPLTIGRRLWDLGNLDHPIYLLNLENVYSEFLLPQAKGDKLNEIVHVAIRCSCCIHFTLHNKLVCHKGYLVSLTTVSLASSDTLNLPTIC